MKFKVHYLSITIFASGAYGMALWDEWLKEYLGDLTSMMHGGRGFKEIFKGLLQAKLYVDPVNDSDKVYCHLELPGQACDAIPDTVFHEFMVTLNRHEDIRVTRLDLAWDEVPFKPEAIRAAVLEGSIRTLAKRRTLKYYESPFEDCEDGRQGTSTCSLGSGQSERMIRVYDKRGPTRLEFQTRGERADAVARDVLLDQVVDWSTIALAHLRDYLDFEVEGILIEWWAEFVGDQARAEKVLVDAREVEIQRMVAWIMNQVSPAMSVLVDVIGDGVMEAVVTRGREKRGQRYSPLLQNMTEQLNASG